MVMINGGLSWIVLSFSIFCWQKNHVLVNGEKRYLTLHVKNFNMINIARIF